MASIPDFLLIYSLYIILKHNLLGSNYNIALNLKYPDVYSKWYKKTYKEDQKTLFLKENESTFPFLYTSLLFFIFLISPLFLISITVGKFLTVGSEFSLVLYFKHGKTYSDWFFNIEQFNENNI